MKIFNKEKPDTSYQIISLCHEFRCDVKNVGFSWKCKKCDYYYKDGYGLPQCMKQNIKDWAIYHAD